MHTRNNPDRCQGRPVGSGRWCGAMCRASPTGSPSRLGSSRQGWP